MLVERPARLGCWAQGQALGYDCLSLYDACSQLGEDRVVVPDWTSHHIEGAAIADHQLRGAVAPLDDACIAFFHAIPLLVNTPSPPHNISRRHQARVVLAVFSALVLALYLLRTSSNRVNLRRGRVVGWLRQGHTSAA